MPVWQHNLILVRDLAEPIEALLQPLTGEHHLVASSSDSYFGAVDDFYTAVSFPAGWSRRMLDQGATAHAISSKQGVMAVGWSTPREFYIQEIGRRFFPGKLADYYFGDFVADAFRGRGLQRVLIYHRLKASLVAGRSRVTALTGRRNGHSRQNFKAEGFSVGAHLHTSRWKGIPLQRTYQRQHARPFWELRGFAVNVT